MDAIRTTAVVKKTIVKQKIISPKTFLLQILHFFVFGIRVPSTESETSICTFPESEWVLFEVTRKYIDNWSSTFIHLVFCSKDSYVVSSNKASSAQISSYLISMLDIKPILIFVSNRHIVFQTAFRGLCIYSRQAGILSDIIKIVNIPLFVHFVSKYILL